MLQPHQITTEYNAAIPEAEREKLKDTAFEDLLRGAQVWATKSHCSATPVMFPSFQLLICIYVGFHTGGNCHPSMGCSRHQAKAWRLGVCEGQCERAWRWGVDRPWVFAVQGTTGEWKVSVILWNDKRFKSPIYTLVLSRLRQPFNTSYARIPAPITILCLSWTLSHSTPPSHAHLCRSLLATVCSSWTDICHRSCSMTRRACIPCSTSCVRTTTRGW